MVCRENPPQRRVALSQNLFVPIEVGTPLLWDNRFVLRLKYKVCALRCAVVVLCFIGCGVLHARVSIPTHSLVMCLQPPPQHAGMRLPDLVVERWGTQEFAAAGFLFRDFEFHFNMPAPPRWGLPVICIVR